MNSLVRGAPAQKGKVGHPLPSPGVTGGLIHSKPWPQDQEQPREEGEGGGPHRGAAVAPGGGQGGWGGQKPLRGSAVRTVRGGGRFCIPILSPAVVLKIGG